MAGTTVERIGTALDGALPCLAVLLIVAAVFAFRAKRRSTGLFVVSVALAASAHAGVADLSAGFIDSVAKRWGGAGVERVLAWRAHVTTNVRAAGDDLERLAATNAYWNRVRYADDPRHWREADYWATPVEMLGSNGGDCEDYVFGKYFTLRALGVPAEKLRMVYVRAERVTAGHMVLAYYPTPDADPLVLDNLTDEILPASQRTDLRAVYSFNDDDLWTVGAPERAGSASQVRAWRELREKMAREARL